MKRVQSSQTPSIPTVASSIFIINSSLENNSNDPKHDKSHDFNYPFHFSEIIYFTGFNFFRQRAKQVIKEMINFDPIHLMGTFNPKPRKMNHLTAKQREECIEYAKQEMLLFDAD
jgi:hypothetical protein